MTLDTTMQRFVFVLNELGTVEGHMPSYCIEVGADQRRIFEKVELVKHES